MRTLHYFCPILLIAGASQAHENQTQLVVKPGLCVMDKEQTQCHAHFQAKWQHPEKIDSRLCLYQAQKEKALYCDQEAETKTDVSWQADIAEKTPFYLKKQDDEKTVAETTVEVAKLVTDVRPRRRYGWSIF